jgi:lambda family phage portal protein
VAEVFRLPRRNPPPQASYEAGKPTPWHSSPPLSLPQDAEIANAGTRLRDWARHLAANSSIIRAVLDSRVANGIGPGLIYEPLVRDRSGALLTELNNQIKRVLAKWRRAPDVTGELSGGELERLLWRAWDTDGEVFLRQVQRRIGASIPYQVQAIEADLVPLMLLDGNRNSIQGIRKDEWGRPIEYLVYRRRSNDPLWGVQYIESELIRIPAASIRHLKRIVRPDQTRGLTLLHAVIFRTADIAEYQQSHRLAARASADLWASINRSADYAAPDEDTGRNWDLGQLQILDNLAPGESVNFHTPAHPNVNATDFVNSELRQIAAGTRSGFSEIAQVWDSSYAAQRLEKVQVWRFIEQDRAQFVADVALPALYEEPLRWAYEVGLVKIPRAADPQTLYDVRIDGPQMPVIDPEADRKAYVLDQENGWDSRAGIIRKMGRSPADVDAEREQDPYLEEDLRPPAPVAAAPAKPAQPAEPDDDDAEDESQQRGDTQ